MDKVARIAELASKTNQFIFTYLRPSLQLVTESVSNPDKLIVTVDVQDSLSQSGTVAALFMTIEDEVLKIDDWKKKYY
jgi:predicted enzyme involved in methoxymalonyl-ACP biosynthesis